MFSFLLSFIASALLTLLVIKESRLHGPALDAVAGVQKVHAHRVARIGGLSIFLAVALSSAISIWRVPTMGSWLAALLLCSAVAFAGGIVEDYTGRVSPARRLLLTMMRLAKEREELKVVADQHGAPTWSRTIADTTALVLAQAGPAGADWWRQNSGVYHLSAQGQTTWFEFTQAIVEAAGLSCRVLPIGSADYPTPARRPQYSVMSSERLVSRFCHLPDWKQALHLCMG